MFASSTPGSAGAPRHRLDVTLVERGLAPTRQRAQALIAAGLVEIDGRAADSASDMVGAGAQLRIVGRDHPWASRGGLKLDAALQAFGVDVADRVVLDAGASTGGFVSVLLSRGARQVYAVDVGHGQLITDIARDARVVVMDKTNVRTLEALDGPPPSLITLDLSFISLRKVIPPIAKLAPGAEVVALFKPQFELGREAIGKGGVVRDESLSEAGVGDFLDWLRTESLGRSLHDAVPAAVRGAKGNQEWLIHVELTGARPS